MGSCTQVVKKHGVRVTIPQFPLVFIFILGIRCTFESAIFCIIVNILPVQPDKNLLVFTQIKGFRVQPDRGVLHIDVCTDFWVVNLGSLRNHTAQITAASAAVGAVERYILIYDKRTDDNAGDGGYRQGRVDGLSGCSFNSNAARFVHNMVRVFCIGHFQHFYAGRRSGAILHSVTAEGRRTLGDGDGGG